MDYADIVLRSAPLLHLPLDDVEPGGTARQVGSAAVVGTYHADARRAPQRPIPGSLGRYGSLSSSQSSSAVVTIPAFTQPTTAYTFAAWVLSRGVGGGQVLFVVGTAGGADNALSFYAPFVNGILYAQGSPGGVFGNLIPPDVTPQRLGIWDYYVLTVAQNGAATLYRNLVPIAAQAGPASAFAGGLATAAIGADPNQRIAHLTWWDRVISPAEMRLHQRSRLS